MKIVWDEPKRLANLIKHRLDFADFETAFDLDRFATVRAKPGRDGRERLVLIGAWNRTRLVSAIAAPLGSEALSLISLRRASERERRAYERI